MKKLLLFLTIFTVSLVNARDGYVGNDFAGDVPNPNIAHSCPSGYNLVPAKCEWVGETRRGRTLDMPSYMYANYILQDGESCKEGFSAEKIQKGPDKGKFLCTNPNVYASKYN